MTVLNGKKIGGIVVLLIAFCNAFLFGQTPDSNGTDREKAVKGLLDNLKGLTSNPSGNSTGNPTEPRPTVPSPATSEATTGNIPGLTSGGNGFSDKPLVGSSNLGQSIEALTKIQAGYSFRPEDFQPNGVVERYTFSSNGPSVGATVKLPDSEVNRLQALCKVDFARHTEELSKNEYGIALQIAGKWRTIAHLYPQQIDEITGETGFAQKIESLVQEDLVLFQKTNGQ